MRNFAKFRFNEDCTTAECSEDEMLESFNACQLLMAGWMRETRSVIADEGERTPFSHCIGKLLCIICLVMTNGNLYRAMKLHHESPNFGPDCSLRNYIAINQYIMVL